MALKMLLCFLALTCFAHFGTSNRAFPSEMGIIPHIVTNPMDCFDALYKARSCSDYIIAYFNNGTLDITPQCCQAIAFLTHQCWAALLGTLGFTPDQTYILRGYCDATVSNVASFSPIPSPTGQPMPAMDVGNEY